MKTVELTGRLVKVQVHCSVLQCYTVCHSVIQFITVLQCIIVQCIIVRYSVLPCVRVCYSAYFVKTVELNRGGGESTGTLQCVTVVNSVLTVCHSVLQFVTVSAGCHSVSQCVTVCHSVLECVTGFTCPSTGG
jgi:hypothetical protein